MKLYLLSQQENNNYDTYDSAVVAAESIEEAVRIHPSTGLRPIFWDDYYSCWMYDTGHKATKTGWVSHISNVSCVEIGEANTTVNKGVVLASFDAS